MIEDLPYSKKKILNKPIDVAKHKAHAGPESDLQRHCEEVLKIQRIRYIHLPNALFKGKWAWLGKRYKGLPDLVIFGRGKKYDRVLFVELKRDVGTFSGGQKTFARRYHVYDVRSVEDFTELLNEFTA